MHINAGHVKDLFYKRNTFFEYFGLYQVFGNLLIINHKHPKCLTKGDFYNINNDNSQLVRLRLTAWLLGNEYQHFSKNPIETRKF